MMNKFHRWFYGKMYAVSVTLRWPGEHGDYVRAFSIVEAHSRAEAASKAIASAQRGVETGWETVTIKVTP